ncbi:MAG TPA: type II secretion system F family protein [Lacipirellulaceae bacterium]|nr:type II secretion system F family protein [Lacipirellulaceae bacterium]
MQFTYTAKTATGDIQTGHVSAPDGDAVKRALREQSLFVIDVRRKAKDTLWKTLFGGRGRGSLSKRDLLSVTTQLAIMTRSGVDLASAFNSLSQQCGNPTLRAILAQVHRDVTGGKSISDAMQVQAAIFGDAYVASVAAGEAAGKLPDVLARLSQFQRTEIRVRAAIRTLLAYPVVLACVSSLVVIGLVTFVLPKFSDIFSQYEIPLPRLTQVVVAVSEMLRQHILYWLPLVVGGLVALLLSRRLESGRRRWDAAMLNTPILREITRAFYIGRTFRLLGLMIESGVPLLDGLRLTRNSIRNSLYRDLFDDLEKSILNGRGLANSLINAGFVPAVAAEMVLTAERTGTLGMVTELMGEHYEEEGESKLREMATILEPLIIVAMGVIVATIVLAVMLPMFDIATMAR